MSTGIFLIDLLKMLIIFFGKFQSKVEIEKQTLKCLK
jgi:hypothetical protein